MPLAPSCKPKPQWDQSAFEKMKAGWTPARIAANDATLKKIFAYADDCPLLAEALNWARENGVKFFIDRKAVNCSGYYYCTTGVIGIAEEQALSPEVVRTLVHEIRHAWQDAQGMIGWDGENAVPRDFARAFLNTALIEADADAYGKRAYAQLCAIRWGDPLPMMMSPALMDENKDLGERFQFWFSRWKGSTQFYGDYDSKRLGRKWGVYDGELPARNFEHRIPAPALPGLNVHYSQDVLWLGMNFSGTKNYLAALPPQILPKILQPSLANTFWGAASEEQRKLTAELRKAALRARKRQNNSIKSTT